MRQLRDVAALTSGQHVAVADVNTNARGTPYLTGPSDFGPHGPVTTKWTEAGTAFCKQGDILVTVKGSGCGTLAVADKAYAISRQLMAVTPIACSTEFLWAAMSQAVGRLRASSAGTIPGLTREQVFDIPIPNGGGRLDAAVASLEQLLQSRHVKLDALLAAKRELKRGLMQELLTGRRRFPGFGSTKEPVTTRAGHLPADWGVAKLGEHASELSQRNGSKLGPERAMGVIKGVGLEPMRDHVRGDDLSRYKVVPPNAFAYNPMRINIGSIAQSRFAEDCLVSPDYVVFATDHSALLPAFLDHLRHSFLWRRFVEAAGAGSVRVRIYFRDLAELWIPLPSVAEQKRIVEVLDVIDWKITLLEAQRAEFGIQRRGLMQTLLSGEIKIPADTPEA